MFRDQYERKCTRKQFEILKILNSARPKMVEMKTLLKFSKKQSSNNLTVQIFLLRRNLEGHATIKTHKGQGYSLQEGGWDETRY